jgi:hypothetical protein
MEYECRRDQAAVLLTQSPVVHNKLLDINPVLKWTSENSDYLLSKYRDIIIDHGLWIISKTYTTKRSGVVVLASKGSKVKIGVMTSIDNVFTLTPESSWTTENSGSAAEIYDDPDGVVIFLSGIYFGKALFRSKLNPITNHEKQGKKFLRGGPEEEAEVIKLLTDSEGNTVELTLSVFTDKDGEEEYFEVEEDKLGLREW